MCYREKGREEEKGLECIEFCEAGKFLQRMSQRKILESLTKSLLSESLLPESLSLKDSPSLKSLLQTMLSTILV